MRTLNVLYVNHYDRSNDSAAISSYEVIRGLISIGHKVIVVTNDPCASDHDFNDEEKVRRVILRLPRAIERSRFLKFLRCTVAYMIVFLAGLNVGREQRIDYIFCQHHNFHFATLTASILSSFLSVPYIVKVQDGIPLTGAWVEGPLERVYNGYVMKALNGYALRKAKYVLALSRELKSLLTNIFRIPGGQVVVVPNTVGTCSVEPVRIEGMRRRLGLEGERILVFVGLARRRGVELLIKALPHIICEEPTVKLLMVSQVTSDLRSLALSLGVEKHVRFVGPVDSSLVPILISMSDVAIGPLASYPATIGAVPRKVLEYMACGKSVVSSFGSVSPDLLINGYNGILVKPGDVDGLSSAIINLMRDEKLAEEIGSNARKHVSTFYGEGVLVKELTTLMSQVA